MIQLKRFSFANQLQAVFNVGSKIKSRVEFALEGLDIAPYLVPRSSEVEGSTLYDLFAVSNHHGTMRMGHYTAYAKGHDHRWCQFDDDRVTHIDPSEYDLLAVLC